MVEPSTVLWAMVWVGVAGAAWGVWRRDLLPYYKEARDDQATTDYPGCRRGIMWCRSTICGCLNESEPSEAFVIARAEALKEEAGDGQ